MEMGRGGLVAYVEAQIERDIALGRLHPSGQFGPEAKLAQRYGVSRGTIREALRRLAARGLVVQHPGRRTRAVALDESLTLENLGLALHDVRSPTARRLLEGYFSLKRQVLVELLVDCCAKASDLDLDRLGSMCFQLWNAGRWEPGAACAQLEFELLRLAARVADRPGHVLLVQSLQRAFLGGAAQLLPLLGGEALREWATCAMGALSERNVQAIQHELPALMKACDELVLKAFATVPDEPVSPAAPCSQEDSLSTPVSVIARDDALEARPGVQESHLGEPVQVIGQEKALETQPMGEACDLGDVLSASGSSQELGVAPCFPVAAPPVEPDSGGSLSPDAAGLTEPSPTLAHGQTDVAGGALHGRLRRWVARLWRSIAHSLGRPVPCSCASDDLLRDARCRGTPTRLSPLPRPDAASRARAGPA
ncbi:FadR/GntR family transcriptional regulator [Corallococcus sp. M7]